jgi:hypothetical protein
MWGRLGKHVDGKQSDDHQRNVLEEFVHHGISPLLVELIDYRKSGNFLAAPVAAKFLHLEGHVSHVRDDQFKGRALAFGADEEVLIVIHMTRR